jgi:hypothetical protein
MKWKLVRNSELHFANDALKLRLWWCFLLSSRSQNFANPCHAVTGQTDQLAIVVSFNAVLRDYARLWRSLAHGMASGSFRRNG